MTFGGGFRVMTFSADATTASIPASTCQLSAEQPNGFKLATCSGGVVSLGATSANLGSNRHPRDRGFLKTTVSLGGAVVRTPAGGSPTDSVLAYSSTQTRDVNSSFDVGAPTDSSFSASVPASSASAPSASVEVPGSWTSAELYMASVSATPQSVACADPTTTATGPRGPHCVPDPIGGRYRVILKDAVTDPATEVDRIAALPDTELEYEMGNGALLLTPPASAGSLLSDSAVGGVLPVRRSPAFEMWGEQKGADCLSHEWSISPFFAQEGEGRPSQWAALRSPTGCDYTPRQGVGCLVPDMPRMALGPDQSPDSFALCGGSGNRPPPPPGCDPGTAVLSTAHVIQDGATIDLAWLKGIHKWSWDCYDATWTSGNLMRMRLGSGPAHWKHRTPASVPGITTWGAQGDETIASYTGRVWDESDGLPDCEFNITGSPYARYNGEGFWETGKTKLKGGYGCDSPLHSSTDDHVDQSGVLFAGNSDDCQMWMKNTGDEYYSGTCNP